MRRSTSALAGAVLVGLAALATALTITTAPARATLGPVKATLLVDDARVPYCKVTVRGQVSMTQAEAQDFLNRRYFIQIRIWGEDPVSDDLVAGPYTLFGPASAEISAVPTGLRFDKSANVHTDKLDEDNEGGVDEIYAGVRLLDPAGRTVRAGKSNYRFRQWFGGNC
jgi:hypothetical protein